MYQTSVYKTNLSENCLILLKSVLKNIPIRLRRLAKHFGNLFVGMTSLVRSRKATTSTLHMPKTQSIYRTPTMALSAVFAWTGRLLFKTLDALQVPEMTDFVWQLFKRRTRKMTSVEIAEAKKVFGNSLPYDKIRIDEGSVLAKIGATINGAHQMGVVLFHTINFTRKIDGLACSNDMAWLIHELIHVAQMEYIGSQYIGEAAHAQVTTGYDYGGVRALKDKQFKDFNREQQGEIVRHYYQFVICQYPHFFATKEELKNAYLPLIEEVRRGEL